MDIQEQMLKGISHVERLARTSKMGRLLHDPFRYLSAILFKDFIYPRIQKEKEKKTRIFSGREMTVVLPSATDIYLTGGKSHDSEIRLARFLIRSLKEGDHFLDIGAHYGYFSLIAADLIGDRGKLTALEPATKSAAVLEQNCRPIPTITIIRKAISDQRGEISFYEFPNLFSEYNAIDIEQFRGEKWFADFNPVKTTVATTTVNELVAKGDFIPTLIKIDVEGAELKVIEGGNTFFQQHSPVVAMEYLEPGRSNTEHRKAVNLLREWGYKTFTIAPDGKLQECNDIEGHLQAHKLESDNIILSKESLQS